MLPEVFNILDDLRVLTTDQKSQHVQFIWLQICCAMLSVQLFPYLSSCQIHLTKWIHIVNTFTMIFTWTSGMISQRYRLWLFDKKSQQCYTCVKYVEHFIFFTRCWKNFGTLCYFDWTVRRLYSEYRRSNMFIIFFLKLVKFKKLRLKHPSRHAWREFTLFPLASR